MATSNKMIGYRPDPTERAILEAYKEKSGLPFSRLIAMAVREKAERDGVKVTQESATGREAREA